MVKTIDARPGAASSDASAGFDRGWVALAVLTVIVGAGMRFVNLERKPFWVDEVIHTHYAFGISEREIADRVKEWRGRPISPEEFLVIQRLNPERGPADVIAKLAAEEPQSPPTHYLMLHYWVQLFGDTIGTRRALSAVLSLLALPCLFWLCLELFRSTAPAWIAVSLAAVSPYFLLFAQETRYYSLWSVVVFLSTALLLRAAHRGRWLDWVAYAAAVALGFYIHPFTGPLAVGHGVYLFAVNGGHLGQPTLRFSLAVAASCALFLPWGQFYFTGTYQVSDWRETTIPLWNLVKAWGTTVSIAFADLNYPRGWLDNYVIGPLVALITGSCLTATFLRAPRKVWLLVAMLIVVIWAPLIVVDLVSGGIRSTVSRYLVPTYLGILVATGYALAAGLTSTPPRRRAWRWLVAGTWVLLIGLGVTSGLRITSAETWWIKANNVDNPAISRLINASPAPLVVAQLSSDAGRSNISLAYDLDPHVRLFMTDDPTSVPGLPGGYRDVLVYNPAEAMLDHLRVGHGLTLEPLYRGTRTLWRVERP